MVRTDVDDERGGLFGSGRLDRILHDGCAGTHAATALLSEQYRQGLPLFAQHDNKLFARAGLPSGAASRALVTHWVCTLTVAVQLPLDMAKN